MGGETLLLLAFGCGVGAYGTLIGMGGGFILVPALLLYPREQTTTITTISLAVVCCSALSDSAAWTYRTGVAFAATVPGLVAGVFATGLSRRDPLRPAARHPADRPGPLIALALWLVVQPNAGGMPATGSRHGLTLRTVVDAAGTRYSYAYSAPLGLASSALVGFLSSLLGIGGGIIHVPAMLQLLHIPAPGTRARVSTATSHFVLSSTAFSGSAVHVLRGALHPDRRPTDRAAAGPGPSPGRNAPGARGTP